MELELEVPHGPEDEHHHRYPGNGGGDDQPHQEASGERARARTTRATTDAQHDPHDRCDSSNSEKKTVPLIGEIHYAEYVSSDDEPSRSGSDIARSSKRLVEG